MQHLGEDLAGPVGRLIVRDQIQRLWLQHVGKTTDGLPFIAAVITSAENMARIDELRQIQARSLSFGDLVFFRSERSRRIHHVGIYIEHGQYVHASTSKGVVISDHDEPYYAHLFMMARRVIVQPVTRGQKN